MCKSELTLRDEIAMSMPFESIPTINNDVVLKEINEKLGIEHNDDTISQIEWAMKFQSIIRYMYADAMLKARE